MRRAGIVLILVLSLSGCGTRPVAEAPSGTILDYLHWIEASDSVAMTGVSDYRIIPHGPVPADENVHIRQRFSVSESIASRHFLIHSEDLEDPASPKLEIQWWNGQRFFLIDERDVVIYPSPPSEEATPFLNPLLLPLQTFIHWYDEGQADTVAALSERYASSLSFKAYCAACLEPGATPLRHLYRDVHDPTKTMDITSIELDGIALPTDITVQDGHELGTITLQWRKEGSTRPVLIRASGQSTNSTDSGSVFHVDLSSMQWGGLSEADLAVDLHGYEHFIDGEAHAPMRKSSVIDGSYLTTSKPRVWWGTGPCGLANAKGPTGGALVGCLYEGSPAKISGLQLGDEIMTIDDAPITNWNQIRTFIINTANPGRNFTVTVIRAGKRVTFDSYIIGLDNASLAKMQALGVSYYKPAPAHP